MARQQTFEEILAFAGERDTHHATVVRISGAFHVAVPHQGIDQTGHGGPGHIGLIGQFGRSLALRVGGDIVTVAPKQHQHAETTVGNAVLGEILFGVKKGFVPGAQEMKKSLASRRIQLGKRLRSLEEAFITRQVFEKQVWHKQRVIW